MGLSELGISADDFKDAPYTDWARSVTRTAKTKTISNVTGSPTYSGSTSNSVTAIFTKRSIRYDYNKEGLVERGDAHMQVLSTETINKEDIITVDSENFRVDDILLRKPAGTSFFKTVILFKV